MTDLLALAERCERENAALVLDGEIWCASRGVEFVMWDGAGVVFRGGTISGIQHEAARNVRPYTASLDAAMDLVPEGWLLESLSEIQGDGMNYARLVCVDPVTEATGIGARTLVLTLCAAALRARSALRQAA